MKVIEVTTERFVEDLVKYNQHMSYWSITGIQEGELIDVRGKQCLKIDKQVLEKQDATFEDSEGKPFWEEEWLIQSCGFTGDDYSGTIAIH